MAVIKWTKEYLEDEGFDGLVWPGICSCENIDLRPCEDQNEDCRPGYLVKCDGCDEYSHCLSEDKLYECYRENTA